MERLRELRLPDWRLSVSALCAIASTVRVAGVRELTLLLLWPAVLFAIWGLWFVVGRQDETTFYNMIDKGSKKTPLRIPPPSPNGSSTARDANGTSRHATPSWHSPPSSSEAIATYTNTFIPLVCLPAPWESSSLLLNIVGEGDSLVGDSMRTTATSLLGVGDSEGYAMRCNTEEPKRCKFVRIGRVSESDNPTKASPFTSDVADPHLEPIAVKTDINADRRKAAIKGDANDDVMRSGDIVMVVEQQSRKTLATSGWWMIFTADSVSTNCYFVITILNDEGVAKYGVPVTAGSPFRLRSAKYPKYEIGCQSSSSIENKGNLLVMYEYSKYLARSSVRWKQGGQVNPLFLSTLYEGMRTSLRPSVAAQRRSRWNLYGGLVSTLSYLRRHPVRNIRVVGHAELLHRLLNKVFLVVIVVVSGTDEYGEKEWMCLRSPQDVEKMLNAAEAQQDIILKSREGGSERKSTSGSHHHGGEEGGESFRTLNHESAMGQDLRLMNHRFQIALKRDAQARGTARALFLSALQYTGMWDSWLLDTAWTKEAPGSLPLGVTLPSSSSSNNDKSMGSPLYMVCVARMLWESHVREELCVLYSGHIQCFPPLSSKASWSLTLRDVVGIADVLLDDSPLSGTFALRIETMGRVHYLSCSSFAARAALRDAIAAQIIALPILPAAAAAARAMAVAPSAVLGGASPDSFTHLSGQWLPTTRLILNARKFSFDSQSRSKRCRWLKSESYWKLSEHLLQAASDIATMHYERRSKAVNADDGSENGKAGDDGSDEERELKTQLLSFLDDVSMLRGINLASVDCSSKEALCFFSNTYHTLLLQARTVLRLPSKSDWSLFFGSVSYVIGDDVFSLAELEQCVLRGKLSRPKVTSRHEPPVLSLNDSHFHYALDKADCRLNFLVNSGSVSNPDTIYLLTPRNLETQLNAASHASLVHSMSVDFGYHTVTLPKVCEVYRVDLGGGGDDAETMLRQCLKYIDKANCGADLEAILSANANRAPTVKYLLMTYESRSRLVLAQ